VSPNRILARADFGLLEPNLEAIELPVRKQLHPRNKRIDHVYFLEGGIASIVANGEHALEIGIIGREGVTGAPIVMGTTERPGTRPSSRLPAQPSASRRLICRRRLG
jgi:hypothetical protein